MLNKIIFFSIKNKLIIGLGTLLLLIFGGYSVSQLPIDAVPDITDNQVQIITTSPSLAAPEVERLISFPIELKMASIPEIEKIRSFSRFGLSVVTLVFKENVEVYWARQQVSERLQQLSNEISKSIGVPEMAPITTGLGEIYQYVVEAEPAYRDAYTLQDLRNIQDWIIRRQLLGTPGVADVSALGGKLEQFEVAIEPEKLSALGIGITDVFQALEQNNENTGGAYIERNDAAYFIRSEGLVGSLSDIENIAIPQTNTQVPVLIKDIAKVQRGHAVRYGASSMNAQGEVVSAIVMMIKGENSSEVIQKVTNRIEVIRKTLPKGIVIKPFLDRTNLVNRAIGTVKSNLIEGALIVIFVLMLILGNFRAGLIVASVIPLALMFAFGMMYLFGVSGNLMSLGAIDFGLIVDGAVIIVEASIHHLTRIQKFKTLTQDQMDQEVYASSSKIRNSAAFGEIIILIVYIPLLALVGTEGKMFRPMAQTVSFAILGAFILSLTYVPMISALFLSKKAPKSDTFSDRFINRLNQVYQPLLSWVLNRKIWVLTFSIALLFISLWKFSRLGGEFIPTLDEGDLAVQATLLTGSSLTASLEVTQKVEKLLLTHFPEVKNVVSKIGSGEIPTDPMPVEAADIMIVLKDRSEWVSAKTRLELVDSMSKVLAQLTGVNFSFQQPIQMRFNELMTGVRQDVAVKIFGEDLEQLSQYAKQVGSLAQGINGASDVYVEEVTGIPQIVITYNRKALAQYNLDIANLNQQVNMAFAGSSAGKIYQGERWFDLVVRLDKSDRNGLESVQNLPIIRSGNTVIPLSALADVSLKESPYQIQRDDTRRRIIVAFNVRNADVETVVKELQMVMDAKLKLLPGYSYSFGGQFENLIEAKKRLALAVPMSLLLILVLLFFTFNSLAQSLLIFTAIPFSAIGGIWALSLRGMPFSISAGVGFIALFGVAVLNGIVLISEFNSLKKDGVTDIKERISKGARHRLRPVIMTAAVASLGFLPMAFSGSAGAEVQKPLATVVIGGLITATLLTMLVLPVLYMLFESRTKKSSPLLMLLLIFGILLPQNSVAQGEIRVIKNIDEALNQLVAYNLEIAAQKHFQNASEAQIKAAWDLDNTAVDVMFGQYNSVFNNDNHIAINQGFKNPFVYVSQVKQKQEQALYTRVSNRIEKARLRSNIQRQWVEIYGIQQSQRVLKQKFEFLTQLQNALIKRLELGDATELDLNLASSALKELNLHLQTLETSQLQGYRTLFMELNLSPGDTILITESVQLKPNIGLESKGHLERFNSELRLRALDLQLEKRSLWPNMRIGYFNQTLNGPSSDLNGNDVWHTPQDRFSGFTFGLDIPLGSFYSKAQRIKATRETYLGSQSHTKYISQQYLLEWKNLNRLIELDESRMMYFQETLLPMAAKIELQLKTAFELGEIDFMDFSKGMEHIWNQRLLAIETQKNYQLHLIQQEFLNIN